MRRVVLACLCIVFGASAITNYTTPKRWTSKEVLTSGDLNKTVDTLNSFTGRVCDTLNKGVLRYKPTTTHDSVCRYLAIDSIRSKPDVDSIQGNPWIDTVTTTRVIADSVIGPVRGNVTSTGNSNFDSIAVTKQVKSAGLNSSGPISGTTITSTSTANLDSLHTTKGATFTGNVGIGTNSPTTAGGAIKGIDIRGSGGGSLGLGVTDSTSPSAYIFANHSALWIDALENIPIYLQTNDNTKMTILSSGLIGINKTSPSARLHVGGSAIIDTNLTVDSLYSAKGIKGTNFTGNLIGNVTSTGNNTFDSIAVTKQVKSAGMNSSGPIVGTKISGDSVKIGSGSWLNGYLDTTFACTLVNVTTTVSGTVHATQLGNRMFMNFPQMFGTTTGTGLQIKGVPAKFIPLNEQGSSATVFDSSDSYSGLIYMANTANFTISIPEKARGYDASTAARHGVVGINYSSITYDLK